MLNEIMDNKPGPSQQRKPTSVDIEISSDEEPEMEVKKGKIKRELFPSTDESSGSSRKREINKVKIKQEKDVNDEKQEFVSSILQKFHQLSPEVKKETKVQVSEFVNKLLPPKVFVNQSSSSDEDEMQGEAYKKSRLHYDLKEVASHGSCDEKVEANLNPETVVVVRKRGRGAHCSNKKCHRQLGINELTVVMIGMYKKHHKKVYFCCAANCTENRSIQDGIKNPRKILLSCTLTKNEKKLAKREFPGSIVASCGNHH